MHALTNLTRRVHMTTSDDNGSAKRESGRTPSLFASLLVVGFMVSLIMLSVVLAT